MILNGALAAKPATNKFCNDLGFCFARLTQNALRSGPNECQEGIHLGVLGPF